MYKTPVFKQTKLYVNTSTEGEPLETKLERIINNKEPIKDGAPIIYTDRKEGVRPSTNIRTDRFEIAVEGMDKVANSYKAKREERAKAREAEGKQQDQGATDGGAKPIQATGGQE